MIEVPVRYFDGVAAGLVRRGARYREVGRTDDGFVMIDTECNELVREIVARVAVRARRMGKRTGR